MEPDELFHRVFQKYVTLDYYESGADMGLSDDLFASFIEFQLRMAKEFEKISKQYNMVRIDGNKSIPEDNTSLQSNNERYLSEV